MSRRGWVSAEVGPDTWKRLVVFDDGWVEISGFARGLSDTRKRLRQWLLVVVGGAGAFLAIAGSPTVLEALRVPTFLRVVVQVGGLVVVVVVVLVLRGRTWRADRAQAQGDLEQARREQAAGLQVRNVPGARKWRRTTSAHDLAGSLTNVRLVAAETVLAAEASVEHGLHVVRLSLTDGEERVLRSPDGKLPVLVLPFGSRRR